MALATPILRALIPLASGLLFLGGAPQLPADPPAPATPSDAYARRKFQEALGRYRSAPDEVAAAWQFGRACFDLAEFPASRTQRAWLAEQGIEACRLAIARETNSAPAHYYLGMNLGQLARTKGLAALKLVGQMEQAFARARELDEHFDYAGADRHLGMLYRDAPAIGSVGSRTRARERLQRAVELAPHYPENRLNLIETYMKWGERANASRELKALQAAWTAARTNFVGEAWAASWTDWEPRLTTLKRKLEEPSKALGTPRAQP